MKNLKQKFFLNGAGDGILFKRMNLGRKGVHKWRF